ncbi:MAG: 50S ribosomal protein L23 [Verrucomicrobiae bacterium]|nr:50S ribosomal protein L23 [Verrucomicrobiae bacterium]MDW8344571.1 50S ribosomal protein L23 [Verrucomicrobiae bacterium]
MRDPYEVVRRVRVTEKGTMLSEKFNQYQLEVARDANKIEIRHAVEKLFKVRVLAVNTRHVRGKARRERTLAFGRTPSWKKAIVTLREGDKINLE